MTWVNYGLVWRIAWCCNRNDKDNDKQSTTTKTQTGRPTERLADCRRAEKWETLNQQEALADLELT